MLKRGQQQAVPRRENSIQTSREINTDPSVWHPTDKHPCRQRAAQELQQDFLRLRETCPAGRSEGDQAEPRQPLGGVCFWRNQVALCDLLRRLDGIRPMDIGLP